MSDLPDQPKLESDDIDSDDIDFFIEFLEKLDSLTPHEAALLLGKLHLHGKNALSDEIPDGVVDTDTLLGWVLAANSSHNLLFLIEKAFPNGARNVWRKHPSDDAMKKLLILHYDNLSAAISVGMHLTGCKNCHSIFHKRADLIYAIQSSQRDEISDLYVQMEEKGLSDDEISEELRVAYSQQEVAFRLALARLETFHEDQGSSN